MRVFVAVEISSNNVIEKISKLQSNISIKAKPVSVRNLHFTLQFLGEVQESMIDKIKKRLGEIKFSKFSLTFQNVGAFPKPRFPRVVWIGTDDYGGAKLIELARKVENVLSPLGFKNDKPFKPHMTIFRVKNKIGDISKELSKFDGQNFGNQTVNSLKLKQSTLTPEGPIYSDLEVINLE
ncbi:MAG: RNA 2',3'-cyclic phosphodiesterase [Nitrosopumilaceae archaeon]|nr:RNA 2',3'-cyclic phosphodiesterase [Nitrosopumilaceae archaeon]